MFLYGLVYYVPAVAIVFFVARLVRRSNLPLAVQRTIFIATGVVLLTPMPSSFATLYVTYVPAALVLISGDPAWYLRFWRFALMASVVTWFLCWLAAPALFRDNRSLRTHVWRAVLGGVLTSLVALVLVVPAKQGSLLMIVDSDTSCHRPLQGPDGLSMPFLNVDLDAPNSDWPLLTDTLYELAGLHRLDFEDVSLTRPDVRTLDLSLCNESGIRIVVSEQRWRSKDFQKSSKGRGISIRFYLRVADENRELPYGVAEDLVTRLEGRWVGAVRFRDHGGRWVSREAAMSTWERYWSPASREQVVESR